MFKYNNKILILFLILSLYSIGIAYFQTRSTINEILFELDVASYTLSLEKDDIETDTFKTSPSFTGSTLTLEDNKGNVIKTKQLGTLIYPSMLITFLSNAYIFIVIWLKLAEEETT